MNPNNPTFREENEVICMKCGQLKKKIEAGYYPGSKKTKRYVDQNNKIWNGKTCPDCNRKRAKRTMQSSRMKNEET